MIDIHTHILPGVDDGAQSEFEALIMAQAAVREGITDLIATPHHANGSYSNPGAEVVKAVEAFNGRLKREGIPLTVHTGQEIRVHDELLDSWSRGDLLPLAGSSYVLIELPGSKIPRGLFDLLHEFSVMGLKSVIAHPERNVEIIRKPEIMQELIEYGAYSQITTHSLLGAFGPQAQRCAWILCRRGLAHLISSDAHHVTRRGFRLAETYDRIRAEFGAARVEFYQNNAAMLLQNSTLSTELETGKMAGTWKSLFKVFLK